MSRKELSPESSKAWNIYTNSNTESSRWKNLGSSMNAISFGFVATAILISMFLIMAIFEHLFRPHPPFSSINSLHLQQSPRLKNTKLPTVYGSDCSVVMPGQEYPTYIAQPAPLRREGMYWPSHYQHQPNTQI